MVDQDGRVQGSRTIFLLPGLLILASLPLLFRATTAELVVVVVIACILSVSSLLSLRSRGRRSDSLLLGSLGLCVPLLPSVGPTLLPLCLAVLCAFSLRQDAMAKAKWALPLLALLTATTLGELLLPAATVKTWLASVLASGGLRRVGYFIEAELPTLDYLLRVLVFVGLISIFERCSGRSERSFVLGLATGTFVACVVTLGQVFHLVPFELPNQTAFWNSIRRFTGTFSDPNAQGVFLALVPLVIFSGLTSGSGVRNLGPFRVVVPAVMLPLLVAAGLVSGSRSFVLIALLVIGVLLVARSRRVALAAGVAAALSVLLITALDAFTPLLSTTLDSAAVPEGARRVVRSLSLTRVSESFFSRQVFSTMALHLFGHSPVVGIGADRFSSYVPSVESLVGIDLKGWVDNSNNFYLGVLTELGVLGVVAVCLCASARRFKDGEPVAKLGLSALAVGLLTGPHLDFSEVLVLGAFLVAKATCEVSDIYSAQQRTHVGLGIVCLAFVGFLAGCLRERGAYDWEKEGSQYHQWLSPAALITVTCGCGESTRIQIESPTGSPDYPMTTVLRGLDGWTREVSFSRPGVREVTLPCRLPPEGSVEGAASRMRVLLTSTGPMTLSDPRMLAVRVRMRKPSDRFGNRLCRQL